MKVILRIAGYYFVQVELPDDFAGGFSTRNVIPIDDVDEGD